MSILPRTIPAASRAALTKALTESGITVGDIKPGTRVTLTATVDDVVWELTYMGQGDMWRATGPGAEHGVAVFTEGVAEYLTAKEVQQPEVEDPFPGVPATYVGVQVPSMVRGNWVSPLADGWRLGVRSATASR